MKSLILKTAIAATVASAAAVATASDWEIGVGLPYYSFDNEVPIDDKAGVSGTIGYRFNKPFGIEFTGAQVNTGFENSDVDVDVQDLRLDGLWYLHNEGNVLPYAALGVGLIDSKVGNRDDNFFIAEEDIDEEYDEETTASIALGVKAHLIPRLRARIEGRWLHGLDSYQNHSIVTLGLGYVFGASESAPVYVEPVFVDGDKDGVEDSNDQCASTPAGVSVDSKGCPIDTDRDGVADYLDQCAETDRKLKVDAEGCPLKLTEDVSIDLSVKFSSGSDVVEAEFFDEIRGVARFMEQYEGSQVEIEGHTDTSGSASFNKNLSQKRATAVANVLIQQYGIAASRVTAMGYGEERPMVEEVTAEDRAANRRVVARVSAQKEVLETKED